MQTFEYEEHQVQLRMKQTRQRCEWVNGTAECELMCQNLTARLVQRPMGLYV